MLLLASGHLYNKIQNLERINLKKKAKITVVPCQTRLFTSYQKKERGGKPASLFTL